VCVGSTGSGAAAVSAGVGGGATVSTGGSASVSGAMLVMGLESTVEGAGAAATGAAAFTGEWEHPTALKDSPLRKKAASNADSVFRLGIYLLTSHV
jgi:hypothetical protein